MSLHFHWWVTTFEESWQCLQDILWWYMLFIEEVLWLKTEFDGRWIFDGRWTLMEYDLSWKTTFDGERKLMNYALWRKTTFTFDLRRQLVSRWPFQKNKLPWKTTFHGRGPSVTEDLLMEKYHCQLKKDNISILQYYLCRPKCLEGIILQTLT